MTTQTIGKSILANAKALLAEAEQNELTNPAQKPVELSQVADSDWKTLKQRMRENRQIILLMIADFENQNH